MISSIKRDIELFQNLMFFINVRHLSKFEKSVSMLLRIILLQEFLESFTIHRRRRINFSVKINMFGNCTIQ